MTVPIKHSPRWLVFLIDLFTCLISIYLAYFIRFEFRIETFALSSFGFVVVLLIFIRATSFVIFRTYAGLIRYTSATDSIRVFSVVTFGSIVLFITNLFYFHYKGFFLIPNSILVIDFFITTITLIGSRLLVKVFYFNLISNDQEQESVVIYGVEQFASMVKTTLDQDTTTNYKVIAFIDPFNRNEGKKMDGIDIYNEFRKGSEENLENVNDDMVFEMELIKQVEINIDYILGLIKKYHEDHIKNREILFDINKAIDSSVELRNKKDLINQFITSLDAHSVVDDDWKRFVEGKKVEELEQIITSENLDHDATYTFVKNAFRDGNVAITGTAITNVLPPVSRFSETGERTKKRENVLSKLTHFFERFFDISRNI